MSLKERIRADYPGLFGVLKAVKKPFNPFLHWLAFGPIGYDTIPLKISCLKSKYFPNLPSRYSRLKRLKNIHKGEKCFIVATGSSLTIHDLELLKGHLSISVNSIVMSYDKTDWRPNYYVVVDDVPVRNVMRQKGESYDLWHNIDPEHIIVAHYFRRRFKLPKEVMSCRWMDIGLRLNEGNVKFSDDFFLQAYNGYTVVYVCLQLAVYMGCSEIYLLGCDCNYVGVNDHAFDYKVDADTQKSMQDSGAIMAQRMFSAYQVAKKYADSHGIKIFNATRGGKLEVFPRISLEEALKD